MNPSYGNGFGSFGSGGAMPGGMPSGSGGAMPGGMPGADGAMPSGSGGMVPGGVPGVAPGAGGGVPGVAPGAGGGAPGVVPGSGAPGLGGAMPGGMPGAGGGMPAGSFGGGMPGNIAPISSGTGDVVLGGGAGASGQKSHKWVVIVVILIVLAIAGGLIAMVLLGGKRNENGGDSGGNNIANTRDALNSYVNYVLFGKESSENVDMEMIFNQQAYFISEGLKGKELETYLGVSEEKINKFRELYYHDRETTINLDEIKGEDFEITEEMIAKTDTTGTISTGPITDYFQLYPKIQPLSDQEIVNLYGHGDSNAQTEAVEKYYFANGNGGALLREYADLQKQITLAELGILQRNMSNGCNVGVIYETACLNITEDETKEYYDKTAMASILISELSGEARYTIMNLYNELEDDGAASPTVEVTQ